MRIDPLFTCNPRTGAIHPLTDDLLAEAYLSSKPAADLAAALEGRAAPWSEGLAAAPEETTRAVEAGLTRIARATGLLIPPRSIWRRCPRAAPARISRR